jgi:hypothetical protein
MKQAICSEFEFREQPSTLANLGGSGEQELTNSSKLVAFAA